MLALPNRVRARFQVMNFRRPFLERLLSTRPASLNSLSHSSLLFSASSFLPQSSLYYFANKRLASSHTRSRYDDDDDDLLPHALPPTSTTSGRYYVTKAEKLILTIKENDADGPTADEAFARSIDKLCQRRAPTIPAAMKLWRAWAEYPGAKPSLEIAKVLLAVRWQGNRSMVPFLLDLKASGLLDTQDPELVSVIVRGCVRSRSLSETLGCLESLLDVTDRDRHQELIFEFLRCFSEAGDIPGTLVLFEEWQQRGLPLTTSIWQVAIAYAMCGNFSGALEALELEGSGASLPQYMDVQKAAMTKENFEAALEVYDVMKQKGCVPPASVLMNCCTSHISLGNFELAIQFYEAARACPNPAVGIKPSRYVAFLKPLLLPRGAWLDRAFTILKEDIALCHTLSKEDRSNFWISRASLGMVLSPLIKAGRESDMAWLLEQMVLLGGDLAPSESTFNILITLFKQKSSNGEELLKLCDMMKRLDVPPNGRFYSGLMKVVKANQWKALCSEQEAAEVAAKLAAFCEDPFFGLEQCVKTPDLACYTHLMALFKWQMYPQFNRLYAMIREHDAKKAQNFFSELDTSSFYNMIAWAGKHGDFDLYDQVVLNGRPTKSLKPGFLHVFFLAWAKARRSTDRNDFLPCDLLKLYVDIDGFVNRKMQPQTSEERLWNEIIACFLEIDSIEGTLWSMARANERGHSIHETVLVGLISELTDETTKSKYSEGDSRFRALLFCIDLLLNINALARIPEPVIFPTPKPTFPEAINPDPAFTLSRLKPGGYFIDEPIQPQPPSPESSVASYSHETLSSFNPSPKKLPNSVASPELTSSASTDVKDNLEDTVQEAVQLSRIASNSKREVRERKTLRKFFLKRLNLLKLKLLPLPFIETSQLMGMLEFLYEYRDEIPHQAELSLALFAAWFSSTRADPDISCFTLLLKILPSIAQRKYIVPLKLPPGGSLAFINALALDLRPLSDEQTRQNLDKYEKCLEVLLKGMAASRLQLPSDAQRDLLDTCHTIGISTPPSLSSMQPIKVCTDALSAYLTNNQNSVLSTEAALDLGLDLLFLCAAQPSSERVWEVFSHWTQRNKGLETDERILAALLRAIKDKTDSITNGERYLSLIKTTGHEPSPIILQGLVSQLRSTLALGRTLSFIEAQSNSITKYINTYEWCVPASPQDVTAWTIRLKRMCPELDHRVILLLHQQLIFCLPPDISCPLLIDLHKADIQLPPIGLNHKETSPYHTCLTSEMLLLDLVRFRDLGLVEAAVVLLSPHPTHGFLDLFVVDTFRLIWQQGDSYHGTLPVRLLSHLQFDILAASWRTHLQALCIAAELSQPLSFYCDVYDLLRKLEAALQEKFPGWADEPECPLAIPSSPLTPDMINTLCLDETRTVSIVRAAIERVLHVAFQTMLNAETQQFAETWRTVLRMHADCGVTISSPECKSFVRRLQELPCEKTFTQLLTAAPMLFDFPVLGPLAQNTIEEFCLMLLLCLHLEPHLGSEGKSFNTLYHHLFSVPCSSPSLPFARETSGSSAPLSPSSTLSSVPLAGPLSSTSSSMLVFSRISHALISGPPLQANEALAGFLLRLPLFLSVSVREVMLAVLRKIDPFSLRREAAPQYIEAIKRLLGPLSGPQSVKNLILLLRFESRAWPRDDCTSVLACFAGLSSKDLRRKDVQTLMESLLQEELGNLERGNPYGLWREVVRGRMQLDVRLLRHTCEYFLNKGNWDDALAAVEIWGEAVCNRNAPETVWNPCKALKSAISRIAMEFLRREDRQTSQRLWLLKERVERVVYGPEQHAAKREATKQLLDLHTSQEYPSDVKLLLNLVEQADWDGRT